MPKHKLEPYASFAEIYDQIMGGVDYEAWADYVELLLQRFAKNPRTIVDLACGTGSSALPFAERGYRVYGVDLSTAMLEKARHKAEKSGLNIGFYKGDLRKLQFPEKFELALLFQDGLNYLLNEDDLTRAFKEINKIIKPGSLFIFDLTRPKLRWKNEQSSIQFADLEDYTLIWESSFCEQENIWSISLIGFHRSGRGLFRKFEETHKEKDYSPTIVATLLEKCGFTLLGLYPSFSLETPQGNESKLTFIAEKPLTQAPGEDKNF